MAGSATDIRTGKDSAEYKVVKNKLGQIVKRAQHVLAMLTTELFSRELVGDLERGNAMNGNQPAYNRTSDLMQSVLTRLESDNSLFNKFLLALKESDLGDLADELKKSVQMDGRSPASPANGSRTKLSRRHYGELIQQLMPVKTDWEVIAVNLGFKAHEIAEIRSKMNRMIDQNYIFDVIEFWLRWAPPDGRGSTDVATLEALQEALRKANHGDIILRIEN